MKAILQKTKVLIFIGLSILMAACLEKQIESKQETPIGPIEPNGVPDDFDYATKSTHTLTVKVMDEYNGERYYTVEVFKANPIANPSAEFICGAKTNKNIPFELEIAIPKLQKQLFIRLTDPKGFKIVSVLEVKEGDLLLDYNAVDPGTKSVLRGSYMEATPADYASVFQAGLNNAEEVTEDKSDLKANGVYKITDKNFDSKVSFPKGKFVLYVGEGCWLRLKDKEVDLANGSELYILKDALVDANSSVFTVKSNSKILNAGTLNLKEISMQVESTDLYNHTGGKINLSALHLNGGNVHNHCLITVSDVVLSGASGNIYLRENASMDVAGIKFEEGHSSCGLYMDARAFLHVNKFHKSTASYLQIIGQESAVPVSKEDYPLIQIEGDMKCSAIIVQRAILFDTKGRMDGIIVLSHNVYQVEGKIPTHMQGGCYTKQNNPADEDFTEDSKDPSYDPEDKETMAYVYLFEDNWPGVGDYDMNDLIVNVGVKNRMQGSNATTAVITGEVLAVGAKKALYVFAQIDGTDKIVNLLNNAEAHAFMGRPSDEIINTYKIDCEAKAFHVEVDVTGMKGIVNANNLNVFIVWGDAASNKRNEVHVVGFNGTKQAGTSESSTKDYKYNSKDEYNNLMWGLMIPKEGYSTYPKEGTIITEAYPGFLDWAKSGGKNAVDWYISCIQEKVFHLK